MSKQQKPWLVQPQRRLGPTGLIVLLVFTSLLTPLSLDMYIPALPHMTDYFDTSEDMVNLTLVGYFLFFAIGLLLFGPFSDRYGRKKVLLAGILAYTLASALCALAPNIEILIAARVVQALGAGAVSAVSTAVIKDAVVPEKREMILGIMQVMFVIGPAVAPVLGALILQFADWRMTFWVLSLAGLLCTSLVLLFEETLPKTQRFEGSIASNIGQLGAVAKHKGFSLFLLIAGLFNLPFMAYIASGSYVYITFFGLSEMQFSYFFAAVAVLSASGPFIWMTVSKYVSAQRFTTILLAVSLVVGAAMLLFGGLSPFLFFFIFLVFAIAESCIRIYTTNILLSQREGDAGAASSLINFAHTALGSVGMVLIVLPWPNYVVGIGALIALTMLFALVLWFFFLKSSLPLKGIKDVDPRVPAATYRVKGVEDEATSKPQQAH